MDASVKDTAENIKTAIRREGAEGGAELISFANTYAVTKSLQHSALLLKLNLRKAPSEADREQVRANMLSLVDEIVSDYETRADSPQAKREQAAIQRVEEHYLQVKPPRDIVFSCEGLGKTYRKSGFSLRDVTLTLRLGEITGVVGENANGKTTLFRLIVGDLSHDAGTIAFPRAKLGRRGDIDWIAVKERIAYVPQDLPRWYGPLEENLEYEAAVHGVRGEENLREVRYIVERLGLTDHLDKKWQELSGGYKLRFSLAKALVWKPDLLVIDEPLANLDFKAQQVILKDLRDLASSLRYPMSVVISSQHLHEIEAIADNIVFLTAGEVTYSGPVSQLGEMRESNTFELGTPVSLEQLRESLSDFGVPQISHNGVAFVIKVPLAVSGDALLRRLLELGLRIDYFRDISRSVKQLFH